MDVPDFRPLSCRDRGCTMEIWSEDPATMTTKVQHGDNQEAVLFLSRWDQGVVRTSTWADWLNRLLDGDCPPVALEAWVDQVHAYEDGRVLAPTPPGPGGDDREVG